METQPETLHPPERLWKAEDVATYLNIGLSTVYLWAEKRGLPCIKIGSGATRYDPEAVKQWALSHANDPAEQSEEPAA